MIQLMDTEWMQAWFVSSPIGRSVGVIIEKCEEAMRTKYNRLSRQAIDSPIHSSRDATIIFNGNVPIWPRDYKCYASFQGTDAPSRNALLAQRMTCTSVIFSLLPPSPPPSSPLSCGCKFIADTTCICI